MANKKITDLTEVSNFTSDNDLIPIVINTDTVPSNASISKANLQNAVGGGTVDSVNGEVGVVVLDTDDLSEGGSNLYYTDARVSANIDVAANTSKNSYPSADSLKLAGIENGAEVNDNAAEIKSKYESNADTNVFTDAEKTNLGNQSGTNTGDQDLSGLQSTLVSGTNIKTINSTSILGSGDIAISGGGSFDPSTDETITGNWEFSNDLAVSSISNPSANVFKIGGNNMLLLEQNSVGSNQSVSFEVGVGSLKSFTFSAPGGQRLERANFSLEQGMVIKNGNVFTFSAPREMLDVDGNVIANGYKSKTVIATSVSGTYNLNISLADTWDLTLTSATTLTESNAPTGTETTTLFILATGSDLTLPSGTNYVVGTYDGSVNNWIVIKYINGKRVITITQPD